MDSAGRYCLNDLHKHAGGALSEPCHTPYAKGMITSTSIEDFKAICGAAKARAVDATHRLCMKVKNEANARGMLNSSIAVMTIDKAAANAFTEFASELFAALKTMNDAEPTSNTAARRDQLQRLLEIQLRELGAAVKVARDQHRQLAQGLRSTSMLDDSHVQEAIDRAVSEYRALISLAITALGNTAAPQPQVVHSPVFHAPVGNYQVGNRNAASVTQSVVAQVAPAEVKAALDALIKALQYAQDYTPDERDDMVEVLEQLKAEADKEKPNRITVGSLIGGLRDVLEGLQAAPEAWKTVRDWYTVVAATAVQAAPVIAQALQKVGS